MLELNGVETEALPLNHGEALTLLATTYRTTNLGDLAALTEMSRATLDLWRRTPESKLNRVGRGHIRRVLGIKSEGTTDTIAEKIVALQADHDAMKDKESTEHAEIKSALMAITAMLSQMLNPVTE